MLEKGLVAHAIIVLIKLAFCTNTGPEAFSLRRACNVAYYLDALGAQVGSISITPVHAEHHDSFYKFRVLAERIKAWYERAESLEPIDFSEMKPSDLKDPLQLAQIGKYGEPLTNFDVGNLDLLFDEGYSY